MGEGRVFEVPQWSNKGCGESSSLLYIDAKYSIKQKCDMMLFATHFILQIAYINVNAEGGGTACWAGALAR